MVINPSDWVRFWSKIKTGDPDECWPWQAGLSYGYGTFGCRGQTWRAHKLAFLLSGGILTPEKPWVLHTCDNKVCCNPRHLYAGDPGDNSADYTVRGRGCLTLEQIETLEALVNTGEKIMGKKYQRQYNVSAATLHKIKYGQHFLQRRHHGKRNPG
jgi:hypothetical protein